VAERDLIHFPEVLLGNVQVALDLLEGRPEILFGRFGTDWPFIHRGAPGMLLMIFLSHHYI
jgi:hypothetical protein